jgi:hypothetical protein
MARRFVVVVLSSCLLPSIAAAETAQAPSENSEELRPRAGSFSLAALVGANYGDEVGLRGNRLMFGYGGRAGYSFATTPLYLGVTVVTYATEVEYDDTTETGTEHFINTDIEVGVEVAAGPLILRPYLNLGVLLGIYEGPSEGNSAILPGLSPGLLTRYPLGPVDVGVDARLELNTGMPATISALASVGVAF